jgi:hypothetical protein
LSGLVLLFALWWLYDLEPSGAALSDRRTRSFLWGYTHYASFAALAALGAGLEVAVRSGDGHTSVSSLVTGYAVAIPTAAFLVLLWVAHAGIAARSPIRTRVLFGTSVAVLIAPVATAAVPTSTVVVIAFLTATAVAVTLAAQRDASVPASELLARRWTRIMSIR